jgi:hypothetical protein
MSPRGGAATTEQAVVIANVSRRRFLQGVSALGGLVLAAGFPSALRAADPPKYGADGMPHGWVDDPLVFVAIGEATAPTSSAARPSTASTPAWTGCSTRWWRGRRCTPERSRATTPRRR